MFNVERSENSPGVRGGHGVVISLKLGDKRMVLPEHLTTFW